MDKSPDAFRTISEVAVSLDTPAHVLRFWESRFPQIKPVKRAGGRRYYRPSDVALLTGIKRLLHDEGLTIRGVQKILRDHGVRHVAGLTDDSVGIDDLMAQPPEAATELSADQVEAEVPEADFIAVRHAPRSGTRRSARQQDPHTAAEAQGADRCDFVQHDQGFAAWQPEGTPASSGRSRWQACCTALPACRPGRRRQ
jgi:DNA-binding transcriptional MerR regulator